MIPKTVVAIVDPYSSGSQLAREFRQRGHTCIMVQSADDIPTMYRSSFHAEDFTAIIRHQGDLDETSAKLRVRDVGCVITGCEMGVELADSVSERLGLVSNGTRLTKARRNKLLMGEIVRNHGLRAPIQFSSRNLDDLRDWVRRQDSWPVVLKPLCSSGSDGVCLCTSEVEVQLAFEDIMNRTNVFGSANEAVLVQEYLIGTQYAVDTVSYAGRHKVASFWKYGKPLAGSSFFGDDSVELLPYDETLHQQLFPLVGGALDALEIRHGPAHCEVICTDHTSWFIEIGARLHGGGNPELSRLCGVRSQIELTVQAYLEPTRFLSEIDHRYELSRRAMRVFLTPNRQGRLQALHGLAEIERLPSFHEMHISDRIGQAAPRIVGWVVLIHSDPQVIHRDRQRIRLLEQQGLYQIEPIK